MALTQGANQWEDNVYLFEETDVVQGGIDGTDNVPLNQLANRTAWLKAQLGLTAYLEDEVVLTASAPIGPTLAGNLIVAYATSPITLTLDDPHTFRHGAILPFTAYCTPGSVVTVYAPGFPIANPVDGVATSMHIHHNEQLLLVALTDHWKVVNACGNFYCVGEEVKARKAISNALPMKGQLLERSRYPRLWAFINSLTEWQEKINENSWWNNGNTYRGLFSIGDGVSTFRLPDERGMFERMLDLGRGLDSDRTHNFPGGYEEDMIKSHNHGLQLPSRDFSNQGTTGPDITRDGADHRDFITQPFGGAETRPKNLGKINLIKF